MDPARRETHTAVVILVGDRAYKVKKPVRLAFLDFSTLAARRAAAAREIALNRRLSPDVYLGIGTWLDPGEPGDPTADAGEPVVVMRRMPDDRRLAALVDHPGPAHDRVRTEIRAVARRIAAFHARATRSRAIDTAGLPETVRAKFLADWVQLRVLVRDPDRAGQVATVGRLGRAYLAGRAPLLADRIRSGCVVDGHGDLLADDIFCLDDGPRILDCLEFDDRLRWGDVLADVAFLAMDLERLGAAPLADALLADYREFAGGTHPSSLAHFHVAARALVRAKIAALRDRQGDPDAGSDVRVLLDLAVAHLERGRITCVLVGGGPGTGKSTLARALAPGLDAVVLAADEVRKELAGLPHDAAAPAGFRSGIYTDAHTTATYTELVARARHLLTHGTSVVLDASWSHAAHREAARAMAAATHSELGELECTVAPGIAATRIARRRPHAPSDATPAVATAVRSAAAPWPSAVRIDTDAPRATVVAAARRAVRR